MRPAAAARDKELNILCWEGYNSAQVLDPVPRRRRARRCKAESLTNDPTMINRLRAGETKVWDLINVNNPWARKVMSPEKLIKPLDRARMEPYFDKMLPAFKPPYKWAMDDSGKQLLGMAQRFGPYSFVVNTDKVSRATAEDQGWDLWNDAANAKKYGILESDDWNVFNICAASPASIRSSEHTDDEVTKFTETAKRVFKGAKLVGDIATMNQALVSGEIDFHLTGGTYSASPARADGNINIRGITPKKGPMAGGKGGISWIEITSVVNNPDCLAARRRLPRICPAAQKSPISSPSPRARSIRWRRWATKDCFKLFTKDELDAIQWDSLEEEMARSIEYDIVPDYDKLLDIMTRRQARSLRRLTLGARYGLRVARALQPGDPIDFSTSECEVHGCPPILQLRNLTKTFGALTAVDGIDLDIQEGEFFTIVGPSGSGKTTLAAHACRDGVGDRRRHSAARQAHQRHAGQPAADLHGVPVAGAVSAPHGRREHRVLAEDPRYRPADAQGAGARADAPAAPAGDLLRQAACTKCSGGERQRVALARALAFEPEILFFDEPLSAIDYKLRKTLEKELKDIHRETGKTFVYITHSLEEAMVMSDRIGVMRGGTAGPGRHAAGDLFGAAQRNFVSEFMGDVNVLPVTLNGAAGARCRGRRRVSSGPARCRPAFATGYLVIRPEFMRFLVIAERSGECARSAGSTMNMCSARASSTRCASASRCSSSRSCGSRLCTGRLDEEVLIGWDARDSILVRTDAAPMDDVAAFGLRNALRDPGRLFLRSALPRRCWQSSISASCRSGRSACSADADAGRTMSTIFQSTSYISFLWSLGLAAATS